MEDNLYKVIGIMPDNHVQVSSHDEPDTVVSNGGIVEYDMEKAFGDDIESMAEWCQSMADVRCPVEFVVATLKDDKEELRKIREDLVEFSKIKKDDGDLFHDVLEMVNPKSKYYTHTTERDKNEA